MKPKYLGPTEGEIIQFLGQPRIFKITPAENGGLYLQYESSTAPGAGAPPHWHREEDEAFFVLAGQYEFLVGETRFTATTGAFAFVPRGIVHAFKNTGRDVARLLITVTPGTQHEGLIREVSELTAREGKPLELPRLVGLAEKYGWVMASPN
jgi:quercetin dioxygenase-like cupin family protein